MRIKVRGGTVESRGSLCKSCRCSSVREERSGRLVVRCYEFDGNIHDSVLTCNKYDDKSTPALWEMKSVAWILGPGRGRVPGFRPFRELSEKEQEKVGDEIRA